MVTVLCAVNAPPPMLRGLQTSMEHVLSVPLQPSEEDPQGSLFSFFRSTQQSFAQVLRPY